MTIIDQPLSLSLLGNIKPFRIGSAEKVSFVLKKGAEIIIQETYDPGTSGVVEIDVKDILSGYMSYEFRQTTDAYIQTNIVADFTATISGTDVTFRVLRGGVDALADTPANFLKGNFLTWQPQIKPVTYYQPEYLTYYAAEACTAKLVATMQDKSVQALNLVTMTAGSAYTIPCQYGTIAAKLTGLPLYYDIYIANAAGDRLTYTQRYYPTAALSEQEQWILFENSLGGMDTFRAYGQEEFTGEHTHNIAEIDEVSEEYRVDLERKHKKNTGYLDEYDRRWLLDFFPSKKKYIYTGSSVRAIVVTESNVTYTDKELPSNFDFTYKYAESKPFLNLVRNEDLPSDLEITLPDATSFTLPPRLIDFERLTLSEGALFPVQSPYAEKWEAATAGSLAEYFKSYLQEHAAGGGIGHQHNNFNDLALISIISEYLYVNGQKAKVGYADTCGAVTGLDPSKIVFNDLFNGIFEVLTDDNGVKTLHIKGNAYTDGGFSVLGNNSAVPEGSGGGSGLDYTLLQELLTGSVNAYQINAAFLTAITKDYITTKLGSTYSLGTHTHNVSDLTNDSGFITSAMLAGLATESYVNSRINTLINGAPTAFDTLKEIADVLQSNVNSVGDLMTSIASKWTQDNAKISNWDAAYGWGNHANAGYAAASHNHNSLYAAIGHTHAGVYSVIGHTHNVSDLFNDSNFVLTTDSRLSDARVASDVYAWAKASAKPGYTFAEITSKPTTLLGYGIVDALSSAGGTISGILNLKGSSLTDGASLGSEQLTSSFWTLNTGWSGTFTSGFAHSAGVSTLTNTIAAVVGSKYLLSFTVTGRTAGTFTAIFGGVTSPVYNATAIFAPVATTTGALTIVPSTDFNGTIVVSLKKVTESNALFNALSSDSVNRLEMRSHLDANTNMFIGKNVGKFTMNAASADSNTAIGNFAFAQNVTGFGNTVLGYYALNAMTAGANNVAIGNNSGRYNVDGSANTYCSQLVLIGNNTYPLSDRDSNEIVIGYGAAGKGSNTVVIGNDSISKTYLKGKVYNSDNLFSTGNIYVGDNRISLADGLPGIALNKAGGIEISGAIPLIDFHFNNSASDYTSRIIEMFSGQLGFDCAVRIGDVATSNVVSDKSYKFAVVGDSNFIGSIRATKTIVGTWSMEEVSDELIIKKGTTVVAKFNVLGFVSMGGLTGLG